MTHAKRLLQWFTIRDTITPLQALQELGIYRLGARVFELREAGHKIDTTLIEVPTAHGDVARVARYSYLGGPDNANQV